MVKPNGLRLFLAAALAIPLALAAPVAADTLTITPDMTQAPAGVGITFVINPKVQNEGDTVSFDFGDGSTTTIQYSIECVLFGACDAVRHAFAGPGIFNVTAIGKIGGHDVSGSVHVTITSGTADQEIFVPTGAHLKGFNNVNWRTDLEINNPGTQSISYQITLLLRDQDNSAAAFKSVFTLDPNVSARYNDILFGTFGFSGAAAIRITPIDGTPIITSRTYNQLPSGTFGQSVPAIARAQAIGFSQRGRLIGVSHDPTLAAGYRTNLGFVNASPAGIHVEAEFYLDTGAFLGRTAYDLLPLEFRQIDKAFEKVTPAKVDDGYIVVRTTTAGAKFFAYAVVTDNITGDPTYVTAVVPQ